jgi:hypothetical protein
MLRRNPAYKDIYMFAFVRNPWDRLLSLYFYRKERSHRQRRRWQAEKYDFPEWAIRCWHGSDRQVGMLTAKRKIIVDYIGYFEKFQEHWNILAERHDLPQDIPHRNKSTHRDYREYYPGWLRDFIGERFQDDIDMFGYSFDGLRDPDQGPLEL